MSVRLEEPVRRPMMLGMELRPTLWWPRKTIEPRDEAVVRVRGRERKAFIWLTPSMMKRRTLYFLFGVLVLARNGSGLGT